MAEIIFIFVKKILVDNNFFSKEYMKKLIALSYNLLRQKLKSKQLDFSTTAQLKPLTQFVGQQRALNAIRFGIGIKSHGYNLYAMGPEGIGKRSLIQKVLETDKNKHAARYDWCYVFNFVMPEKPAVLRLPAGMAIVLQRDMKSFIDEVATSILSVFEGQQYLHDIGKIQASFNVKREKEAKQSKSSIIPSLYKLQHQKEQKLQHKLTLSVVKPLIKKLKIKYKKLTSVVNYLTIVQDDIILHVHDVIKQDEETNVLSFSLENPILLRYQINVLVDNSKVKGAPIIFEENPSYSNLICRVEHTMQFGALVTNFTLIKGGALHYANGGYLIIEARKLKKEPRAWEGLKRALYSQKIIIDPVENLSGSVKPISLEPIAIPLDIKVILMGDRSTYYYLSTHDPDFNSLFKVAVDFDEHIERNPKNINLYSRLIATFAKRENLKPLKAEAVAEIIDHSTRLAEDVKKLSTHIRMINDVILEADYWAGVDKKRIIDVADVKKAVAAQIYRVDRTREGYYQDIKRNFVLIATKEKVVGQINCLSVVSMGKFAFGHPTRVTAKVRMGRGKIVDIQREIDMAGPIHAKGSLILANFLSARYNPDYPFSLSASIAMEQIYGMVEGDSASVAELCALLSALANVPIKQSLAITGSINQYGEVQMIGGVNEKIEGFFDICKLKGLNGKQGVIIPSINVETLMLRDDIVEAAKQKKFAVYIIDTVDEAITLLTGMPAGERDKMGHFPHGSINDKVEKRLELFAKNFVRSKAKS